MAKTVSTGCTKLRRLVNSKIETYPGYGFQTSDGKWRINVSGLIYHTQPLNLRQRMLLRMLGNAMQASESELEGETFKDRIWPFFVEGEKGIRVFIEIGNERFKLKKKTGKNGRFFSWPTLPDGLIKSAAEEDETGRRSIEFQIVSDEDETEPVQGKAILLDNHGLSIISDIDDTIKESVVTNRRELLQNTFLNNFKAIEGMSDVYRDWYQCGAEFHYVSSSPWQLYRPLDAMKSTDGFPPGTVHLRNFRLRDQLLKRVMIIRRKGKAQEIKSLLKNLPDRKFILVGDSGEKDPEIYGKAARKFPRQVAGIFVRELRDRPVDNERTRKAMKDFPEQIFNVFRSAEELAEMSQPLFEQHVTGLSPLQR